ncbi:hypothetical protein Tco_1018564 [Tanacetum coccineum]|uniref:Helitron helicase-like domain-containing protein n=1 Tax=Tanacetum coccineum TaxID=301880 RepID=A0ABQ5FVS2_9ASTR
MVTQWSSQKGCHIYIESKKDLRSETYFNLAKLAADPDSGVTIRGKKVVLPSSYTGSPRYMMQNYLDAMTICKNLRYPDLFITFTCNPNWPEIARFVAEKGLKYDDRPDIITRDKLTTAAHIDKYISVEIPDKDEDLELYQIVTDRMMHGPCGAERPSCPYTVNNKCTKKFHKQFNETTFIDESGYSIYKIRNDGCTIQKQRADLHNGYVVPYNPGLLRHYQSHINVEWCNQISSIKYLFKYIYKGLDRVIVIAKNEEVDEISDYYDCRYLSACEATWRIYVFNIHYRFPPVERLLFHLPNEQSVIFDKRDSLGYTLDKASVNETKFQAWMETNKTDTFAQKIFYVEFSKYYVRGATDWEDFKKFDDVVYPTFKDACYARGLLEDDKEYIDRLLEASH